MSDSPRELFAALERFIQEHGVRVVLKEMDVETPGEFDGLTITINPKHDQTSASYYLAHAFGSIVQWSTDTEYATDVYERLRAAKKTRQTDPEPFEAALRRYRQFEQTSSDHAVWMLREIGHGEYVRDYTQFFRADIEAMTIMHRVGKEPSWPEFYDEWRRRVAAGEVQVEPFTPRPIAPFRPVRIQEQQVVQEHDS